MLARVVDRHTQMQQLLIGSCKVIKVLVLVLCIFYNPLLEAFVLNQSLHDTDGLAGPSQAHQRRDLYNAQQTSLFKIVALL